MDIDIDIDIYVCGGAPPRWCSATEVANAFPPDRAGELTTVIYICIDINVDIYRYIYAVACVCPMEVQKE